MAKKNRKKQGKEKMYRAPREARNRPTLTLKGRFLINTVINPGT